MSPPVNQPNKQEFDSNALSAIHMLIEPSSVFIQDRKQTISCVFEMGGDLDNKVKKKKNYKSGA